MTTKFFLGRLDSRPQSGAQEYRNKPSPGKNDIT